MAFFKWYDAFAPDFGSSSTSACWENLHKNWKKAKQDYNSQNSHLARQYHLLCAEMFDAFLRLRINKGNVNVRKMLSERRKSHRPKQSSTVMHKRGCTASCRILRSSAATSTWSWRLRSLSHLWWTCSQWPGFVELHLRLRLGAADELQLIRFIMLHKPVATGSFGANSPPTTYLCPPNFVVPKNFFY